MVSGKSSKAAKPFEERFQRLFGFCPKDLTSFERFTRLMYRPTDPSSLGVTRILFGLLMIADLPEERAGAEMDLRWGDPKDCHFPLFDFLRPLPLPYMGILYGAMFFGAIGVMLGYKFRFSILMFTIPYWYLFLLDKSFWNNHSYLFGLISILLLGSSANHFWSIDGLRDSSKRDRHVPLWNYFILKFQFFILYFIAGLKKSDKEWLEGYAMSNLGSHWVFNPFTLLLTREQIDYLIIHWFAFVFDLTVGFWMLYDLTRPCAMIFCAMFHFMNTRLFSIGMFPYVCLATMPLYCDTNWPRKVLKYLKKSQSDPKPSQACIYDTKKCFPTKTEGKHYTTIVLILAHCFLQFFLPYSHFITKGYNNWTQGLYGYSWDMMVHTWDTVLVVVKVVDNQNGKELFLDPQAWTQNDRWTKHADMSVQYAQCLRRNLVDELKYSHIISSDDQAYITSENISIYVDVWCSLNGRFQQRMFNPNYDLLRAKWSPFEKVEWLMPLLREYSGLRQKADVIQKDVYSWSNYSDVLFVADFPGMYLENYISPDFTNVSLTVLEGRVIYESEQKHQSQAIQLAKGSERQPIRVGEFHRIHTISNHPSSYLYTFYNRTKMELKEKISSKPSDLMKSPFPFLEEMTTRLANYGEFFRHIGNSVLNLVYGVPMVRRVRVRS